MKDRVKPWCLHYRKSLFSWAYIYLKNRNFQLFLAVAVFLKEMAFHHNGVLKMFT